MPDDELPDYFEDWFLEDPIGRLMRLPRKHKARVSS